ncbi:antA/AntB antirepressor family protein [Clostridium sp.]|uniref:antA/AntB antirepressor family protein n=1 Tax=Clostridium sp. TaxID=1506 RepID=UPI0035A187FC
MRQIENGLIPVMENEKGECLVDGRELHEFLKVQQDFSDWIKKQLDLVDSKEGETHSLLKGSANNGGGIKIDYILRIEIAKEICMIAGIAPRANEETKKLSKQARQYFIAVEKKYKAKNTQSFTPPEQLPVLKTMNVVKFIADDLRVSTSSRIKMYRQACENEGVKSNFLPDYTDEKAGKSATELLKKFNVPMTAVKFNKLMLEHEFLQEETRTSTNRQGFKKYKSLTDKGLKYGKNKASTHGSEKETQPLYYEDSFIELVNVLAPLKEVI